MAGAICSILLTTRALSIVAYVAGVIWGGGGGGGGGDRKWEKKGGLVTPATQAFSIARIEIKAYVC